MSPGALLANGRLLGTEGGAQTVRPWARGQSVRVVRRCERWEGGEGWCDVDMARCEDKIVGESGGLAFIVEKEIGSRGGGEYICKKILSSAKKVSDTLKTEKLNLEMKFLSKRRLQTL